MPRLNSDHILNEYITIFEVADKFPVRRRRRRSLLELKCITRLSLRLSFSRLGFVTKSKMFDIILE